MLTLRMGMSIMKQRRWPIHQRWNMFPPSFSKGRPGNNVLLIVVFIWPQTVSAGVALRPSRFTPPAEWILWGQMSWLQEDCSPTWHPRYFSGWRYGCSTDLPQAMSSTSGESMTVTTTTATSGAQEHSVVDGNGVHTMAEWSGTEFSTFTWHTKEHALQYWRVPLWTWLREKRQQ